MGKNRLIVKQIVEEEKGEEEGTKRGRFAQQKEEPQTPKKQSKGARALREVISGAIIKDYVLTHILFILFIALITLLYISNTYYALSTIREIEKAKNQLKELRYKYVLTKEELIEKSRRTKVIERLKLVNKDLKESTVPPYKINE